MNEDINTEIFHKLSKILDHYGKRGHAFEFAGALYQHMALLETYSTKENLERIKKDAISIMTKYALTEWKDGAPKWGKHS